MRSRSDVVVIGSGAAGCAAAYFLTREGVRVTIIEQEAVASFASGFAAGLLNPLRGAGIPGPLLPLAMEAFRMHTHLAERLPTEAGMEFGAHVVPYLYLAFGEEEAQRLHQIFAIGRKEGFPVRWLDGREVKVLEPRLSPRVARAVSVGNLRCVDSYRFTLALLSAAERCGATLRHGAVRGIRRSRGRVSGVVLGAETVACDTVVLAIGPWSRAAGRWLGVPIPVDPLKGQILRLRLAGPPLAYYLTHEGAYLTSKSDGLIWAGTTEERVGFRSRPTRTARDAILKSALAIMPALADAEFVLHTACLRPVSADMLPIIGPVPDAHGAYLATGGGRKGILLSPAMGLAVADLIIRGHTRLPVEAFSPARFSGIRETAMRGQA